uniref:Mannosylglucosyl-3-phosphoglycerate phosphatase-like isoform X2 n=2 Tax=Hirondellea gigas TaxID=1518452 RepID=A0A6A7G6W3_9CRUS
MRTPNDTRLAENVDGIDLILGGHDHVYEIKEVNGKYILKSGTDFREFSHLRLELSEAGDAVSVSIEKVEVTGQFSPNEAVKAALQEYEGVVTGKMDEVLCNFSVELDGRFSSIRTSETNLGNFICDIIMAACNADIAILNSGTLRSDRIHPAGDFVMRDLMTILPMLDSLCVLEVTGAILLQILENGVCQYPKLEGRFPQVAGVQFVFDASAAPGSRIIRDMVKVGDEYLQEEQIYRMCTKAYMRLGRDGYNMLVDCPVLQDDEQCPMLSTAVQNHFTAIKTRQGKTSRNSTHRQSLVLLSRRHSLIRSDEPLLPSQQSSATPSRPAGPTRSMSTDCVTTAETPLQHSAKRRMSRQDSVQELEDLACKLAPVVEGRIVVLQGPEQVQGLREKRLGTRGVSIIEEEEDEPATPVCTKSPLLVQQ